MAETRAAWGIDIGQSGLKAMKVRHIESAGQVVAEAFDYIEFPKILSQPDAIPEEIVPEAMNTFLTRNDLKGDLVSISVPGQSALTRFIDLPPVESSKLHEIVKYEARQQIPFALEDVIWDYQPLGAGMEEGGFLLDAQVGLFAMKRDDIAQQLFPYQEAKVEVDLIQIAPLALYNVLSVDEMGIRADSGGEESDDHSIVLDMGCDNTTLLVSNGYNVWVRNVPIGGNHFTRALTKEMKLSFAKAEHLKRNATKAPDPRAVFQALRPVFNDYVSEIQRSIGFFSSVNRQAKITKVLGVGNGFKLAGLQKFLQQNLQYEVERPDTFRALAGDAVLNSPLFADNVLSFAVPYGLCLQSLGLSRIRTTLLPPEISAARRVRKKKPWVVATAASMLLGFSLSTAGNAFSNQAVFTEDFADAQTKAEGFKSELGTLASNYTAQTGAFDSSQTRLDSLVKGRRDVSWLNIYNSVIDSLPRDPDNQEKPKEIALRNQMSLTEVSSEKVSDVSAWYEGLSDQQKQFMSAKDKEEGPSGEGYIFTVRGQHWHHEDRVQQKRGVLYVVHSFLRNLQSPTVQTGAYPVRDVTRMGISHATIMDHGATRKLINLSGKPQTNVSRITDPKRGGGSGYSGPGGPGGPGLSPMDEYSTEQYNSGPIGPMNPKNNEDILELHQTDFVIQFAFVFIPEEERVDEEVPAEGDATAEEGAEPTGEAPPSGEPGTDPTAAAEPGA